ncbi:MAG: hypothetical protein ACQES8_06795 [Thermodesulfobacteriota bacterium]
MVKKILITGMFFVLVLGAGGLALAHTPLCSCYEVGDDTVICEGGFSDGSSAAGVSMRVVDEDGNVLEKGKMDDFSEFTFEKPDRLYKVIFDAGPGHEIEISGKDIAE